MQNESQIMQNNMDYQEIDLIDLIKKILKFWWLILLMAILASSASYYYTKTKITPIYQTSTTLFAGSDTFNSILDWQDIMTDSKLVLDYRELIKTNLVLEQTIEELGLDTTAGVLRGKIGVSSVPDTRFLTISVKDPNPEVAQAIANKVSEVLKEHVMEIIGVQSIRVVDYALLPKSPISPSTTKNVGVAFVLGVMVALFIIFLNMMLSTTIEKEEDIELTTGLPIIGVIPKFKGEKR